MPSDWDVVGAAPAASAAGGDWDVVGSDPQAAAPRVQAPPVDSLTGLPLPHDAAAMAEQNAQDFVNRLEAVGQQMEQNAVPPGLRAPQTFTFPVRESGANVRVNPTLPPGPVPAGVQQMTEGVEQAAEPGLASKAGGASKILRGGMEATAGPLLPASLLEAPAAALTGVGTGTVAGAGTEAGLKKAGVKPDYAELAGDVAGLAAGGAAAHLATPRPALTPDVLPPERSGVDRQVEPTPAAQPQTVDLKPEDWEVVSETKEGATTNDNRNDVPVEQRGQRAQGQGGQDIQTPQTSQAATEEQRAARRTQSGSDAAQQAATQEPQQVLAPRPPATEPAYGHQVVVNVPGETTTYPARYAVRELEDVQPSHNPFSFEPNPDYEFENDRDYSNPQNAARVVEYASNGNYKPDYTLTPSPTAEQGPPIIDSRGNALGGNNRTMTLARVYENNSAGADAYRQRLAQTVQQFGIDPAELSRFGRPILTRELSQPVSNGTAQKAITDFNKTAAAKLSPQEQAVTDGRRLSPDTIQQISGNLADVGEDSTLAQALQGDRGADIVQSLVRDGVLTDQEKNGYVDERGFLTPDAKQRIAKALVGRLFDTAADYSEAAPEIRNKLERIAPQVLRVEDRPAWSLTEPLREAVSALADAKAHGTRNLDDLASQSDLTRSRSYSPDAIAIAKTLQLGPVKAAHAFRQYANDSELSRDGAQSSFFEPPTQREAFDSAFGADSSLHARDLTKGVFDPGRTYTRKEVLRDADWELHLATGRRPVRLRANWQAMQALAAAVGHPGFRGVSMPSATAQEWGRRLRSFIETRADAGIIDRDTAARLHQLADALYETHRQARGAPVVVYKSDGSEPLIARARLLREELAHAEQQKLGHSASTAHVDAGILTSHPAWPRIEAALRDFGYADANRNTLIAEAGAQLAAGRADILGIKPADAISFLSDYFHALKDRHGDEGARAVLQYAEPSIRRQLGISERRVYRPGTPGAPGEGQGGSTPAAGEPSDDAVRRLEQGRREGTGGGVRTPEPTSGKGFELKRPPVQGRLFSKGLPPELRGPSMFDEPTTGERSLFDPQEANKVTESAAADKDRLERERMEARLNSPLTRESQKQKLKRSTEKPQTSFFEESEPDQGMLFSLPKRADDDPAKVNYSGMGAVESKLVRNLGQLRRASEPAFEAAARAASSRSQASVVMKTAMPKLVAALGSIPKEDFFRALIQSRLTGIRDRWQQMSDFARRSSDENLEKSLANVLPVLEHIEDRAGFDRNLAETAGSLAEKKDYGTLRQFLSDTFGRAAGNVATVMQPQEFNALRGLPNFRRGLAVYKNLVEQPMAESHELNEGVFSTALGPLDTYYPLVPVDTAEHGPQAQRADRQQYARPKNLHNNFATGLADDYEASAEALRKSLTRAIHTNNNAALMEALEEHGIVRALGPFERPGDRIVYGGQELAAVVRETSPGRQIIENGKSTYLPPRRYLVPRAFDQELEPILARQDKLTPSLGRRLMNVANTIAISGAADFVYHSSNLFGALVANTPFLGDSLIGKVASAPVLKRFAGIVKVLATDPTTQDSATDLQQMAKLGILPDRYGSETYSKKYADLTGAKLHRLSAGPMLYGPKGIDVRARLVMYRLAKEINPEASGAQLHMFVNQLGTYVDGLQSEIVRGAKRSGLAPFAEAGTTMLRNGVNAWTGAGPMPKSGLGLRIWQQLTGGGAGLVAMWALAYHAYTQKWPWEDKRAKLLQIPATPEDRKSKLGRALWGKGNETGYLNFTFFNPLAGRGARALGIKGAADDAAEGGKWWQLLEAAQKDMMNAYAHPFLGPLPRAAFVGLTGSEPYVTGLRDDRARLSPQLMPAVRGGAGTSVAKRAAAGAAELNSFYGNVGAALGGFKDNPHDTSDRWTRMVMDLALPGLIGQAQNPYAQRARVLRQAALAQRAR